MRIIVEDYDNDKGFTCQEAEDHEYDGHGLSASSLSENVDPHDECCTHHPTERDGFQRTDSVELICTWNTLKNSAVLISDSNSL